MNPVRNSQNFTVSIKENNFSIISNWVKKLLNNLLDFIWPQFCIGCNREGSVCCAYCLNDILLKERANISWPKENYCFEQCLVCCDYHNQLVKKIIKQYKYSYLENMSDFLVNILEKQARRICLPKDTIISNVPLHSKKKKQRGFDQTEILAKKLAKKLDLKYIPLLIRTRQTKTQAQLSKSDRQKNVQGVFKASSAGDAGVAGNILLIDDIATTGSTLNQACLALKNIGYQKITCLVIAKN